MKPKSNRDLVHFLFDQMDKLNKNEINVEQAKAQANLSKQVNNSFRYELDRVKTLIKLSEHNKNNEDNINLNEI